MLGHVECYYKKVVMTVWELVSGVVFNAAVFASQYRCDQLSTYTHEHAWLNINRK